jgi:hypothetical protein
MCMYQQLASCSHSLTVAEVPLYSYVCEVWEGTGTRMWRQQHVHMPKHNPGTDATGGRVWR